MKFPECLSALSYNVGVYFSETTGKGNMARNKWLSGHTYLYWKNTQRWSDYLLGDKA